MLMGSLIMHALHAPEEQGGIPAAAGACYLGEALIAILDLREAYSDG